METLFRVCRYFSLLVKIINVSWHNSTHGFLLVSKKGKLTVVWSMIRVPGSKPYLENIEALAWPSVQGTSQGTSQLYLESLNINFFVFMLIFFINVKFQYQISSTIYIYIYNIELELLFYFSYFCQLFDIVAYLPT